MITPFIKSECEIGVENRITYVLLKNNSISGHIVALKVDTYASEDDK